LKQQGDVKLQSNVKLLALDTSTEACSVALHINNQVLTLDEVCPQQHSKRILPMIQQLLSQADLSLQQLDGIVFGRGPGSFTGVRIGAGVCQGLGFGANLPVYGVSTLAAMAQAAYRLHGAKQVVAAIDARMAEVYLAAYQLNTVTNTMQPITAERAVKPNALSALGLQGHVAAVGTGWQTYQVELQLKQAAHYYSEILYPSAHDMLTLALPVWQAGEFIAAEFAEPSYVRDEVTWQKLPGR
jgi:tRNA threonylcarbamoyladenosine biosynthesis protein TsaB